jgi:hypothetical protein
VKGLRPAKRTKRAGGTFIQRSRAIGAEEKALYHSVTGAGRSQVKRNFFDLSRSDEDAIVALIEQGLDEVCK